MPLSLMEYCKRCGGKCCYLHLADEGEAVPCPRLREDGLCSVYKERYAPGSPDLVVVGYWRSRRYKELDGTRALRPFWCGRILQIHAAGGLKKEIADRCAALHPELLEEHGDQA